MVNEQRQRSDWVARLRRAIDRIGLKTAVGLLADSKLEMAESISEATLIRWRASSDRFPPRAEPVVELLETACLTNEPVTLTFATIPNPAAIPLIFVRPLTSALVEDAGRGSSGDLSPVGGPLPLESRLRICLQLTLEHKSTVVDGLNKDAAHVRTASKKKQEIAATDVLLNEVAAGKFQMTIVPERTFDRHDDRDKMIKVCRISQAPTIFLHVGSSEKGTRDTGHVFYEEYRTNLRIVANRLLRRLRNSIGRVASGSVNPAPPSPEKMFEEIRKIVEACGRPTETGDGSRYQIFVFATTVYLSKILTCAAKYKPFWPGESLTIESDPRELTDWYLVMRKDAFQIRSAIPLLAAIQRAADDAHVHANWLLKNSDVVHQETGLNSESFQRIWNDGQSQFRCDKLTPLLLDGLLPSICGEWDNPARPNKDQPKSRGADALAENAE